MRRGQRRRRNASCCLEEALAGVEAIKQKRIVEIDFAYTTPGIRNVAAVRKLAEALYPERFR